MYWATIVFLLNALLSSAQEEAILSKSANDSLLWGPYRPNLYFGVRPRIPKSLSTGLLWGRVEDYNDVQHKVRFTCEQHEGMAGYGWDAYDPRRGGVQTVRDKGNGIDLETSFVKFDEGRGGWGAKVKGTVREDAEPGFGSQGNVGDQLKTSIWFTAGVAGLGSLEVQDLEAAEEHGVAGDVVFNGQTTDLGDFKLTISESAEGNSHPIHNHPSHQSKPLDHTIVHSVQVPEEALWQSKGMVLPPLHDPNRCFSTSLSC